MTQWHNKIFLGSVFDNVMKKDDFQWTYMWFHAQLVQKILNGLYLVDAVSQLSAIDKKTWRGSIICNLQKKD